MKYYKINKLENMMANIVAEGYCAIWQSIEEVNNPFMRANKRKLFAKACKKLSEGK